MYVKFGRKVRGQVVYLFTSTIFIGTKTRVCLRVLRDVNGKEFYPILVFNSPRESTQLHNSTKPDAHVCDAIPPLYRYGRSDATALPKIDTKTSLEPRFSLKKQQQKKKKSFP